MRDTFSHQIWCSTQSAVCRYPSTSKIYGTIFLSRALVDRIRWRNKPPETPDLYFLHMEIVIKFIFICLIWVWDQCTTRTTDVQRGNVKVHAKNTDSDVPEHEGFWSLYEVLAKTVTCAHENWNSKVNFSCDSQGSNYKKTRSAVLKLSRSLITLSNLTVCKISTTYFPHTFYFQPKRFESSWDSHTTQR
jgi:hypothetical protein